MKKILLVLSIGLFLASCGSPATDAAVSSADSTKVDSSSAVVADSAKQSPQAPAAPKDSSAKK